MNYIDKIPNTITFYDETIFFESQEDKIKLLSLLLGASLLFMLIFLQQTGI